MMDTHTSVHLSVTENDRRPAAIAESWAHGGDYGEILDRVMYSNWKEFMFDLNNRLN